MNYDTEAWYKLYIRESTEDRLLPVLNRSLRDFLLRLAKSRDDATILAKTENPGEDLARALGAHQDEHDAIVAFVDSMLADGFLSHKRGRLWITNFVEAQLARSPGARRQRLYRENKKRSRTPAETDEDMSVTGDADVTASGDAHATSHPRRSEESRKDPSRGESKARPPTRDRFMGSFETKLPDLIELTEVHRKLCRSRGLDLEDELGKFRAWAKSHERVCLNWSADFELWLRKSRPMKRAAGGAGGAGQPNTGAVDPKEFIR